MIVAGDQPDIPEADRIASRTERLPGYVQPRTAKLLSDAATKHKKTLGEIIELTVQRSSKLNALKEENEALRAELAKHRENA